ncbi:MAG TPA: glycoside hydrolase 43 family protein, partial [Opitutales bacterium]|nr:glycoside hydrolase 43 family protein [Opitutales bacterium]
MKANQRIGSFVRVGLFLSAGRVGVSALAFLAVMGTFAANTVSAWQADNGDGTYCNPPLYADYPDPDIIRVGDDFYFASSTFANCPGLNLLDSKDLVNWEIVGHVMPVLEGGPEYELQNGGAYRHGVYAPSLRHRDGVFYLAVTLVGHHTRIYYSSDIRGPWQFHELECDAFDPGLFFGRDGTPYIASSSCADGHVTLFTLTNDCSKVDDARPLFYYPGIEGSKVILKDGWYYVFNSMPVKNLGFTVSRAKNLEGPWETKEMLGDSRGGHQGAIVDLPDGSFYGFIMKDCGAVGRMTYL